MTSPLNAAKYLAKEAGIPVNGRSPFTDYGNAERLAASHREDLRYLFNWKKWLAWSGSHWEVNADGEVMRRAKATVRSLYQEAGRLTEAATDEKDDTARIKLADAATAMMKWARLSESNRLLEAMITLARSEPGIPIQADDLDQDPWLFNCLSGTIDLKTGNLRPHNRSDLITKLSPTEYDANAKCPLWLAFLDRVLASNQPLIDFLQRALGYSLTGIVSEHCLFVVFGTGRNGKSTFLNTFLAMMGGYAHKTPPDLLLTRYGQAHPTERAVLHGTRFAPATETAEGHHLDEVQVKELTGGDRVIARRMREDFWQFPPTHHLWLATNHKPIVRGTDLGIWSRLRLIPFTVTIPIEERDTSLMDKLQSEWPSILGWAVQGCLDWQAKGLMEPIEVWQATSQYRNDMDVIGAFLAEHCVEQDAARSTAKDLYQTYQKWTQLTGERTITKVNFGLRLQERGYRQAKGAKGVRLWLGLRLLGEDEEPSMQPDLFTNWMAGGVHGVGDTVFRINVLTRPREEINIGNDAHSPPAPPTNDESPYPWDTVDDNIGI